MSKLRSLLLAAVALCAGTALANSAAPTAADADAFIAQVNAELLQLQIEGSQAQWLAVTYINGDSQGVASRANEKYLKWIGETVEKAKRFDGVKDLSPATARAIKLLKLGTSMPAPKDPAKLRELTEIATRLEGTYGAGKHCKDPNDETTCRNLDQLSKVLAKPAANTYEALTEAWAGWHTISRPMRKDYQRFVELTSEGSKELGYPDLGTMWRSAYDLDPDAFQKETDRLWGQVKPLYDQLHCYVRGELNEKYGDKVALGKPIPAQLLGNMWAQEWGNIYDLVAPYPKAEGKLDVDGALEAKFQAYEKAEHAKLKPDASHAEFAEATRRADRLIAEEMVRSAESFYVSLGMRKLPDSFCKNSQFLRPRDRDVVCHASAWDFDQKGDVRIKMCISPTYEDLSTIYHELGHLYYDLAYNPQPSIFQGGAHDGFHEAIGDTIVLAMTPKYLQSVGLVGATSKTKEAVINEQMKMALDKVAFLPFGLLIDRWRWDVFSGKTAPADYNDAWWALRTKYQGVMPPVARDAALDFDPGAKYHVPGNTPYTRYFLARILQFQFYRSLCDAAGHKGALYTCSFANSKAAGDKYWAMMAAGQSQPWPDTLKKLTGKPQMDASALVEYFEPLSKWLKEQNKGKTCGW
jgi:peptidyl-dipeptidase A